MKQGIKSALITVVILHGDSKNTLMKSIQSVLDTGYDSLKVVVVDNGSKDESLKNLSDRFPSVQVISSGENLGIASGRNLGLEGLLNVPTEYIFLMDDDIILDCKCLSELVEVMKYDEKIGVAAPVILKENGYLLSVGGKYIKFISQPFLLGYDKKYSKKEVNFLTREVDYVTGAIALVKKDVFNRAGLFDSRFDPYGFEDIDWSLRVKKAGYKIMVSGKAFAVHLDEFSFFQETPERLYETTKKRLFLARKHLPDILFFLLFLPFFFLRGLVLKSIVFLLEGKITLIKATARGIFYGLRDF